jgi:hypothetical protein
MAQRVWRVLPSLFVLAVIAAIAAKAANQSDHSGHTGGRQYYGNWHGHTSGTGGASYRTYYYKPTPDFVGFKHHYVMHYDSHPQFNYFYNPYTKQFWGRCAAGEVGEASYSLLEQTDRSGDINKIAESAFPKPGAMPPIPESKDGETLDLPPDDLPSSEPTGPTYK